MTRAATSTAAAALAALAVLGDVGAARAQSGVSTAGSEDGDDYRAENSRWNGLNTLTALAEGENLEVEARTDIDWEDIGPSDILLIIYPRDRVEPGHVAAFVRNGGRLILADDFGDSSEALGRLGMLRQPAVGVAADRFYRELPYVPLARALLPDHPLAAGVAELATNHPAVLSQTSGPEMVFGFGPGEGVVAAGALGRGTFVVTADPSVLINRMLQFDGNLQFAINTLRFLRHSETRRLIILAGEFDIYGEPEGTLDDGTVSGTMSNMLSDFNRWLDERNDYLLTAAGIAAVSLILAFLIGFLAVLALPAAVRSILDGAWTRAQPVGDAPSALDFEGLVDSYDQAGPRGNFLVAAAVIRDTISTRLARVLGDSDPLHTRTFAELHAAVTERCGAEASDRLGRIHKRIKNLPSRTQASSPWGGSALSRHDFEVLEREATALLAVLDDRSDERPR